MKPKNYIVQNTESQDLDLIYLFFEKAIEYINQKGYVGWTTYDKHFIEHDFKNNLQFKIVQNHRILCVFSICLSDDLIWRNKEKGDAIYLHRVVVNPLFKGQRQFQKILEWATEWAQNKQLKYVRMDTWAKNPNIINYYKSFGFKHIENYTTPNSLELPIQHRNLKVALLQFAVIT